jgi:hypothetical protein
VEIFEKVDVEGFYLGFRGEIREKADVKGFYSDFSGSNIVRNLTK